MSNEFFFLCPRLFFSFLTREAKCKRPNFTYNCMKIETGLEKNIYIFEANPPPSPEFPGPLTPPTPRNFQSLPWGGYGYFLELHNIKEFVKMANHYHDTIKFTAEIPDSEIAFLDTKVYKGERFNRDSTLDVQTHYKQTETFQYTNFYLCHPPGVKKGFIKGEALRLSLEQIRHTPCLTKTCRVSKHA